MKLIANDAPDLPCWDETIEKCFDIHYLDWNKEDIPYLMKTLHGLWLSWGGRGSTLLGWSNRDQNLATLQKVGLLGKMMSPISGP